MGKSAVRIDRAWWQRRHASPPGRVVQPHTEIDGQSIVARSGDQFQRGRFCPSAAFGGRGAPFRVVSVVPQELSRKVLVELAIPDEHRA